MLPSTGYVFCAQSHSFFNYLVSLGGRDISPILWLIPQMPLIAGAGARGGTQASTVGVRAQAHTATTCSPPRNA